MRSEVSLEKETRHDLSEWSEPLIGDCLSSLYFNFCANNELMSQPLVRQHLRFWKALLDREEKKMESVRRDLLTMARAGRLTEKEVDEVDAVVLDELVQVVALRYRRSPTSMRAYNRVLIETAEILTETRLALAA